MTIDHREHYIYKIWADLGWTSSTARLKGLKDDLVEKQRNIWKCQRYYDTGEYLKAKCTMMKFVYMCCHCIDFRQDRRD